MSLAFITAVQRVPPRQRAALILRDVPGFPASEAVRILEVTEESLTSALKRARANLRDKMPARPWSRPAGRAAEKDLAERLTEAYQAGDVAAIIALFSDDAWLTMPPFPLEYQGRELIGSFLAAVAFRDGRTYRLIETRANSQLAFGGFLTEPRPGDQDVNGLIVLALTGGQIAAMTRFPASVDFTNLFRPHHSKFSRPHQDRLRRCSGPTRIGLWQRQEGLGQGSCKTSLFQRGGARRSWNWRGGATSASPGGAKSAW